MKLTIHWLAWNAGVSDCTPCDEKGFITEEWEEIAVEFSLGDLMQRIQPYFVTWPHPNWSIQSFEFDTEEV